MSKFITVVFTMLLGCSSLVSADEDRDLGPAIEKAYSLADKVFVGTAMSLPSDASQMVFHVIESFKGEKLGKVFVSCKKVAGVCESGVFDSGAQYLVYVSKNSTTNTYDIYPDVALTKLRYLADLDVELLRDIPLPFYRFDDSTWWFDE